MVRFFFLIILLGHFHFGLSQTDDVKELTKLNQDWLDSYSKKDSTTLSKIFADDFVLISPKGVKMTKRDIVDNLQNQETVSTKIDNIEVRILTREVGLITAYTTFVLKVDGKLITGQNCYQDVYQKRDNRWVAVSAHVTLLSFK